jgi:hypothetical protein
MSRIIAALVAVVCTLTLSAVAAPADAARPGVNRTGNGLCC